MSRRKRDGRAARAKPVAPPPPKVPAPLTHLAALVAGAIAMIVGASTFSWWRFTTNEGLGLREFHVCAFDACKPYDYAIAVGPDHQAFVMLGTIACYGAFAVGALALIAAYTRLQRTASALNAARSTAVVALVMIGVAVAFVLLRPDELDLSADAFQKARLYMRATSLGWSAIAYFGGGLVVIIASAVLSRRKT